jgi:hypothetical protein
MIFLAPQLEDGTPNPNYAPIWLQGKPFDHVVAIAKLDARTLGIVKRITKHNQDVKVVYGVRVAACHFDDVARSILEDESIQPHVSMPKRFVVSRVPLGTDAKDLRKILDSSLVLKDS